MPETREHEARYRNAPTDEQSSDMDQTARTRLIFLTHFVAFLLGILVAAVLAR